MLQIDDLSLKVNKLVCNIRLQQAENLLHSTINQARQDVTRPVDNPRMIASNGLPDDSEFAGFVREVTYH